MIIRFISDTHGYHRMIKNPRLCDLFVHSGDGTNNGTEEESKYLFEWLNSLPAEQVLFVPGNHDSYFANDWGQRNIQEFAEMYPKVKILTHDYWEFKGIRFFCSSWTPEWGVYAFTENREKMQQRFNSVHGPIDILITHGPGWGILDNTSPGNGGLCVGCVGIHKLVERVQPLVHSFGHIHQSRGHTKLGRTLSFNSAFADWMHTAQALGYRKPYDEYEPNWIELDSQKKVINFGPN